ncbi:MAG: hypothetical protein ACKOAH_16085 [Pirellula sp.]
MQVCRTTSVLGDHKRISCTEVRIVLRNHILADFELADTVGVTDGACRIRCTAGIGCIPRIADRDKLHVELIGTGAKAQTPAWHSADPASKQQAANT